MRFSTLGNRRQDFPRGGNETGTARVRYEANWAGGSIPNVRQVVDTATFSCAGFVPSSRSPPIIDTPYQ